MASTSQRPSLQMLLTLASGFNFGCVASHLYATDDTSPGERQRNGVLLNGNRWSPRAQHPWLMPRRVKKTLRQHSLVREPRTGRECHNRHEQMYHCTTLRA